MNCVFGFDYCASGLLKFSVSGSKHAIRCHVCGVLYCVQGLLYLWLAVWCVGSLCCLMLCCSLCLVLWAR
jgi:hypothetical protein